MNNSPENNSTRLRCLVTGASRGIGRAIALNLAASGYDIAVHYVGDREGAEVTANQVRSVGVDVQVLQFELRNRDQVRLVLESDMEANGTYYGVVCNAGISIDGVFPMLGPDDWDQVVEVNLGGFYNVLSPVVMPMIRRRKPGRIVTLSSVSGMIGNRGQVNYSASKAGIIGASKALALELASRAITVNCVAPGLIATDMTRDIATDEMLKMIPCGRIGTAEDVAATVGFLMSDAASYITRQVIAVNGGLA